MLIETKKVENIILFFVNSLLLAMFFYGFIAGLALLMFYLEPSSTEISIFLSGLFSWGTACLFLIGAIIITFCNDALSFETKKECLICGKKDYLSNGEFVVINKKTISKFGDVPERCVCKTHKKPYMVPLKEDW